MLLSTIDSFANNLRHYDQFISEHKLAIKKKQYEHHYGGRMYLRFGKYPKSERSRIGLDQEWIDEMHGKRFENGVSVYKTYPQKDKWVLIEPNKEKAIYNAKFDVAFFSDRITAGEIYLLTGKELPNTGVDGEPLITDVVPVKKLLPSDVKLGDHPDAPTLDQYLGKYHSTHDTLGGFSLPPGEKRQIALGLSLLIDDLEDDKAAAAMKITELDIDLINNLLEKLNFSSHSLKNMKFDELTSDEMDILKNYIKKHQTYRNKRQVMKGFRPFY